ncbi:MAG: hypothetical protein KIT80_09960 [Chitinophagaceae bacterium]|nr:hypothetical protein [Chitinophagaceae bacterium]MCW5927224.1 hypothetical protein [Chitinophagaceae bacterium]
MKYILFALLTIYSFGMNSCSSARKAGSGLSFAPNVVVAHRGAFKKNQLPENSLASLREAIRLGCTGSEFDVHMTSDDSLVVTHDNHFHGKEVARSTYADLVSNRLSNGEKLPTAREYLLEGMKQTKPGKTMLVFELKPSIVSPERGQISAQKTVELVKELKAGPWVMYISFDYGILKKILELDPTANTAYLNGDKSPLEVKKDGIRGIDYHYGVFQKNKDWIKEAKDNNIHLNVWTVNKAEDLQWYIDQKFDYITTNEPELLFELLNKK